MEMRAAADSANIEKEPEMSIDRSPAEAAPMNILITGATGFVGKAVLLNMCSRHGHKTTVYLLIRAGAKGAAEERFARLLRSPCFAALPMGWKQRVKLVHGDIAQPHLGLSAHDHNLLSASITCIIHCAAAIDFDLPLRDAAVINCGGSLEVLQLAHACVRPCCLVYCSTAYALPLAAGPLSEDLPHIARDSPLAQPEKLWTRLLEGSDVSLDETRTLLHSTGHPNTYTCTKCLAELLLASRRGRVPLCIVRPSIVGCAAKRPHAGWHESKAGLAAFAYLVRLGALHTITGLAASPLDVVPVDLVAAKLVDAGVGVWPGGHSASVDLDVHGLARPPGLTVLHAVAGPERSVTINQVVFFMCAAFTPTVRGPFGAPFVRVTAPRGSMAQAWSVRCDLLAMDVRRLLATLAGKPKLAEQIGTLRQRMLKLHAAFGHFTHHSYAFEARRAASDETFDQTGLLALLAASVDEQVVRMLGERSRTVDAERLSPTTTTWKVFAGAFGAATEALCSIVALWMRACVFAMRSAVHLLQVGLHRVLWSRPAGTAPDHRHRTA